MSMFSDFVVEFMTFSDFFLHYNLDCSLFFCFGVSTVSTAKKKAQAEAY